MTMSVAEKQTEPASLTHLIEDAVREPNVILSNLKVTHAHYMLSTALGDLLGPDSGANFHTWAVWGSRKAGVTIREEGLDRSLREVTIIAFCVGLLTGFLLGVVLQRWLPWWIVPVLCAAGALCGTWTGRRWLISARRRAADLMLAGNRIVLEDIGGQTARFVAWFRDRDPHDSSSFPRFLEGFRPGEAETGGQDLLCRAFQQYYRASQTSDPDAKQQAAYGANCLAILQEHLRLQPYICGALPRIVRRCVTQKLMRYDVGPLRLAVGDDVPSLGGLDFPEALRTIADPELDEFLFGRKGLNIDCDTLAGTRATDWTQLPQRMKYILTLFRALHLHPDVSTAPYSAKQFQQIRGGQIPPGPL
jgi:hypothetical protein